MNTRRNFFIVIKISAVICALFLVAPPPILYSQGQPISPIEQKRRWWDSNPPISTQPIYPNAEQLTSANTNHAENWWWFVFQSYANSNWDIYLNKRTGFLADSPQLTTNPANDTQPRLNRGATRVVFVSQRDQLSEIQPNSEIYSMNIDGSGQTRLTNYPGLDTMPVWSPDGAKIAFVSDRDGNAEIYTMNADGSQLDRLTINPGDDIYPTWSPDSQQIAWVRRSGDNGTLWVMDINSRAERSLTAPLRFLAHTIWSPNSTKIAFDYDADHDGWNRLALVQSDGTNFIDLPNCITTEQYEDHGMSSWEPDGKSIYYNRLIYKLEKRQFFLVEGLFQRVALADCSGGVSLSNGNISLNVDMAESDLWAPSSHIEPLPAYTRLPDLFVKLQANDVGPSGLAWCNLQIRTPVNANWIDFPTMDVFSCTQIQITDISVGKLFLRSQAVDKADNTEAWPPNLTGDAETTLYNWRLDGHFTDPRGLALPQYPITIQPNALFNTQTDSAGDFFSYLASGGKHTINKTHVLVIDSDHQRDLYLAPPVNLLQNGDFEADPILIGWKPGGTLSPTVSTTAPYEGKNVVRLGHDCALLCIPELNSNPSSNSSCLPGINPGCAYDAQGKLIDIGVGYDAGFQLLPDEQNNLHLLGTTVKPEVFYQYRSNRNVWSVPQIVTDAFLSNVQMVLDQQNNLYLVWSTFHPESLQSTLSYRTRQADGTWTEPILIDNGAYPHLVKDQFDTLHLLYVDNELDHEEHTLFYRSLPAGGVWSSASVVTQLDTYASHVTGNNYQIAVTPHGIVHFLWFTIPTHEFSLYSQIVHQIRYPNGTTTEEVIPQTYANNYALHAVIDSQERLHLLQEIDKGNIYIHQTNDGNWSTPVLLGQFSFINFGIDGRDTLFLIGAKATPNLPIEPMPIYLYKPKNKSWSDIIPNGQGGYPFPGPITIGQPNELHMIWRGGNHLAGSNIYSTTEYAGHADESELSQRVTLPANIHQPTLAFMYQLEGGTTDASFFDVTVTDAVTTTRVFSTNNVTPWTLGWADLAPWPGETVTVTFRVHQASNDTYLHVYLDEVSLGAWETPVPQTISPARVEANIATTILISGENFIATPTVQLNDLALTNVRWLNEHQLEVDLPETIRPGIYDLQVINPGGQMLVKPGALKVGQPIYLPVIAR